MDRYSEDEMQEIRQAVEQEVFAWPGVTARRMFGLPGYLADGKVFLLLVTGGVVLTRLAPGDLVEIASRFQVTPFEAHGRLVKAWIQVAMKSPEDVPALVPFLRRSYEGAPKKES